MEINLDKTMVYDDYKLIQVKGKQYRIIDFENEWTAKHSHFSKPLITKLINKMKDMQKINVAISHRKKELGLDEKETLFDTTEEIDNLTINTMLEMLNFDDVIEAIAMLYTDKEFGKEVFSDKDIKERTTEFWDITISEQRKAENAIMDFFDTIVPQILRNSQTFLMKGVSAIIPKQTTTH